MFKNDSSQRNARAFFFTQLVSFSFLMLSSSFILSVLVLQTITFLLSTLVCFYLHIKYAAQLNIHYHSIKMLFLW